jgi:multidrug efflux pump subunit AcrA (membrane-fusion protein)
VKEGDVLIHMEDTQARSNLAATNGKFAEFAIQEARLIAERDRKDHFDPPASIGLTTDENVKLLAAQKALFDARRTAYLGQQKVLTQRIVQSESATMNLS